MRRTLILLATVMLISSAQLPLGATCTVDVKKLVTTTESFLEELNEYGVFPRHCLRNAPIKYYKRALEINPESESAMGALKKLGVAE